MWLFLFGVFLFFVRSFLVAHVGKERRQEKRTLLFSKEIYRNCGGWKSCNYRKCILFTLLVKRFPIPFYYIHPCLMRDFFPMRLAFLGQNLPLKDPHMLMFRITIWTIYIIRIGFAVRGPKMAFSFMCVEFCASGIWYTSMFVAPDDWFLQFPLTAGLRGVRF